MGRSPCCDKVGLKKGPWTAEEDEKLMSYINEHGHGSWRALPKKAGLLRCGKSCRLRWTNYLRPDIKRGEFTALEEQTIIQLHALLGNRWSAIASYLSKRTDNEIKNHWNTHLKKRLIGMGLDPATHKPRSESAGSSVSHAGQSLHTGHSTSVSLTHMAQWESARLEAEARLAKESALRAKGLWTASSSSMLKSSNSTASSRQSPIDATSMKPDLGAVSSPVSQKSDSWSSCSSETKQARPLQLVNSLQNWDYSLQGQAGLLWPNSWIRASSRTNSGPDVQQDSSSSSSVQEQINQGSPISTLSSLDYVPLSATRHNLCRSSSSNRKLSWIDTLQVSETLPSRLLADNSMPAIVSQLQCDGLMTPDGAHRGHRSTSPVPSSAQIPVPMDGNLASEEAGDAEGQATVNSSPNMLIDLELMPGDISSPNGSSTLIKLSTEEEFETEEDFEHYWDHLFANTSQQDDSHGSAFL
ncbi:hypothetical protein KP509_15G036300 [Ceratopteris richardii]|uniref:Uncharacterized protein n=1 Tax=Ceratopteris richardii TaxID=49495 RepID=A0A8T2T457_CERRI|nr:hypothetical protein KP509_15G036300 [Ceratopteris richardii]